MARECSVTHTQPSRPLLLALTAMLWAVCSLVAVARLFAECAQTLLSFVRRIVKQYPLLRPRALDVLRVAFVVDQTEEVRKLAHMWGAAPLRAPLPTCAALAQPDIML